MARRQQEEGIWRDWKNEESEEMNVSEVQARICRHLSFGSNSMVEVASFLSRKVWNCRIWSGRLSHLMQNGVQMDSSVGE